MNKGIRNCKLNFSREQINIPFHHIDYNNDKQHGLRKKQKKSTNFIFYLVSIQNVINYANILDN